MTNTIRILVMGLLILTLALPEANAQTDPLEFEKLVTPDVVTRLINNLDRSLQNNPSLKLNMRILEQAFWEAVFRERFGKNYRTIPNFTEFEEHIQGVVQQSMKADYHVTRAERLLRRHAVLALDSLPTKSGERVRSALGEYVDFVLPLIDPAGHGPTHLGEDPLLRFLLQNLRTMKREQTCESMGAATAFEEVLDFKYPRYAESDKIAYLVEMECVELDCRAFLKELTRALEWFRPCLDDPGVCMKK